MVISGLYGTISTACYDCEFNMNRKYHRWWSPSLQRDMELLIFGHAGRPLLVFPTSLGSFFEYENNGMIGAVQGRYAGGNLQAFCVSSVDGESWYNKRAHPGARIWRQVQYQNYILNEVLPLIRQKNGDRRVITTGCSFGAYHALNLALRHPDVISGCVSMGGAFDIKQFLHGYYDNNVYFNNPPDYLANLSDGWYLDRYRANGSFVLATSDWDICLGDNYRMAQLMGRKGVPHSLDVWGGNRKHDWPTWREMAVKFFGQL